MRGPRSASTTIPMIAKLIAYGEDRRQAIGRHLAPRSTPSRSAGVSHNIPFLAALMRHPRFISGRLIHRLHRRGVSRRLPWRRGERGGSAAPGGGGRRGASPDGAPRCPGERAHQPAQAQQRGGLCRRHGSGAAARHRGGDRQRPCGDRRRRQHRADRRMAPGRHALSGPRRRPRGDGADRPHRHRLSPEPRRRRRRRQGPEPRERRRLPS